MPEQPSYRGSRIEQASLTGSLFTLTVVAVSNCILVVSSYYNGLLVSLAQGQVTKQGFAAEC